MPATAVASIGGAVLGAGASMSAANKAAAAQEAAAAQAARTQMRMFRAQTKLQAPFRQAGLKAQNRILTLLGLDNRDSPLYGDEAHGFRPRDFKEDPGYAFRQSEGMKALERSAAARGILLSGSTLKGIERFGQDLASQDYQSAFNRFYAERAARLNPLQSLMGAGQSSANTLTGAAGQVGQGVAQTQMAAGQARASGYVGGANALNSAIGGITNYFQDQPLRNAMVNYYNNGSAGSGTPTYGSGYDPSTGAMSLGTIAIPASQRW